MFDNPITRAAAGLAIAGVLLTLIIILMPNYPIPAEVEDALSWLFETIWILNFVLPIPTMMEIIGIYLLLDIIFVTIKIVLFAKSHMTGA